MLESNLGTSDFPFCPIQASSLKGELTCTTLLLVPEGLVGQGCNQGLMEVPFPPTSLQPQE